MHSVENSGVALGNGFEMYIYYIFYNYLWSLEGIIG